LGYEILRVEDGRVTFEADEEGIARANIFLRSCERVLLKVGEFEARTYDELFEGTKALPLEDFLPRDAKFWVTKASSVKSALFSPSDIQRIMKKAMAARLGSHYGMEWLPENGASYPFRVSIKKDLVTVGIDMSGASLHKRGYRVSPVIAPISETLAASLIKLTPWRRGRILVDPFCGSGTFLIEAAMMAANIAPGLKREFTAESWNGIIHAKAFREARRAAQEAILPDIGEGTDLQGFDIDPGAVRHARDNARAAGVEKYIHFQQRDVKQLSHPKKYGFLITNPPYGERIEDKGQVHALYETLGENYRKLDAWSMYVITAYPDAVEAIGARPTKNRKIYNGMMKTYFYEYSGPKPPKAKRPAGEV
ncbi:MAG: class I SAM-dependent RNA methyltransferase, partial [Lachnospiraceae bacterium]|nr:class I SAM-dependent RNA methyltransferase [Lachnospiraceae bacterium]